MEDHSLLSAALVGYQWQAAKLTQAITGIQARLKGRKIPPAVDGTQPARKKHHVTAAGRRAIREAQLKRWAAAKKATKKNAPKAAPAKKRKLSAEQRTTLIERLKNARAARAAKRTHHMSAAGRARIAEAQRKRWAAAKKASR